jgi:hypothetical protein
LIHKYLLPQEIKSQQDWNTWWEGKLLEAEGHLRTGAKDSGYKCICDLIEAKIQRDRSISRSFRIKVMMPTALMMTCITVVNVAVYNGVINIAASILASLSILINYFRILFGILRQASYPPSQALHNKLILEKCLGGEKVNLDWLVAICWEFEVD